MSWELLPAEAAVRHRPSLLQPAPRLVIQPAGSERQRRRSLQGLPDFPAQFAEASPVLDSTTVSSLSGVRVRTPWPSVSPYAATLQATMMQDCTVSETIALVAISCASPRRSFVTPGVPSRPTIPSLGLRIAAQTQADPLTPALDMASQVLALRDRLARFNGSSDWPGQTGAGASPGLL